MPLFGQMFERAINDVKNSASTYPAFPFHFGRFIWICCFFEPGLRRLCSFSRRTKHIQIRVSTNQLKYIFFAVVLIKAGLVATAQNSPMHKQQQFVRFQPKAQHNEYIINSRKQKRFRSFFYVVLSRNSPAAEKRREKWHNFQYNRINRLIVDHWGKTVPNEV